MFGKAGAARGGRGSSNSKSKPYARTTLGGSRKPKTEILTESTPAELQIAALKAELAEKNATIEGISAEKMALEGENAALRQEKATLTATNTTLSAERHELMAVIRGKLGLEPPSVEVIEQLESLYNVATSRKSLKVGEKPGIVYLERVLKGTDPTTEGFDFPSVNKDSPHLRTIKTVLKLMDLQQPTRAAVISTVLHETVESLRPFFMQGQQPNIAFPVLENLAEELR